MASGTGTSTTETRLVIKGSDQTEAAFRSAGRRLEDLTRKAERNASQQNALAARAAGGAAGLERRLTAATAAMAGGELLRQSVLDFAAMDRRMTRLGHTADRSKGQIGALKADLIKLADDTAQPIDEVIKGFETFVRQTGDFESARKQITNIAEAAQGMNADIADVSQTVRVLQRVIKIDPKDTAGALDMIASAGNKGAFEAKNLAVFMPMLGESMSRAGLTGKKGLAEALAMLQTIQETVKDPEQTANSFRDFFQKMGTDETNNHFEKVGVNMQKYVSQALRKGDSLAATVIQVTDATLKKIAKAENVPEERRMQFLSRLFPEQDSQRAVGALLARYLNIGPLMDEIMNKSAGTIAKQNKEVVNDTTADLTRLGNKFEEVKFQLGKSLIDAGILTGMDEFKKDMAELIKNLDYAGNLLKKLRTSPLEGLKQIGNDIFEAGQDKGREIAKRNMDRHTLESQKATVKAQRAREAGQPITAERFEYRARNEAARALRIQGYFDRGTPLHRLLSPDSARNKKLEAERQERQEDWDRNNLGQRFSDSLEGKGQAPKAGEVLPLPPNQRVMKPEFIPQNYQSEEGLKGLIHKTAYTQETRDATERGQTDQRLETERTNELLRRLIERVSLRTVGTDAGGAGGMGGTGGGSGGSGGGASGTGGGSAGNPLAGGAGGSPRLPGGGGGGGAGLSKSARERAMQYYAGLRAGGMDAVHANALMGHAMQETGGTFDGASWNKKEQAGGMLQYRGNRLANLKAFAQSKGKDWTDPKLQGEFATHEQQNDPYERKRSQAFRDATDVDSANRAAKGIVRYGDNSGQYRNDMARKFADGSAYEEMSGGTAQASDKPGRGKANLMRGQYGAPGQNLVQIRTPGGKTAMVHKDAAPSFQRFVDQLEKDGYPIKSFGGHGHRNVRGSSRISQHAFGNAIDINASRNPMGPNLITDMPADISDRAAKEGLTWGGDWKRRKDAMHFEWNGTRPWEQKGDKPNESAGKPPEAPAQAPQVDANTEKMKAHREEMEKPIKIRYETDGIGGNVGHRGQTQARREQEYHMRSARYNSYSEVGVA